MPKLILKEKGKEDEHSYEFSREEFSIGRGETNTLCLANDGVSRRHAKIIPDGRDFYIIDLTSGNGTRLNGLALPKNEKYILKNNDIITIDKYDLRFQSIDELLNQSFNDITDSDILEVKLLKKVLRALDRETIPSIEVLNGTAEGRKAFLPEDVTEIVIGRDPMTDFQIEEYVISRKHARITQKWGGLIVQDLGSKNGVYVNNRRVTEEFLHDGDRIALGTIVMIFRNPKEISLDELGQKMMGEQKQPAEAPAEEKVEERKVEKPIEEPDEEELSYTGEALSEEEQEKLVEKNKKRQYPAPHKKKQKIKFSAMELALIGLGALVFIFAFIMLANLLFS